MIGEFNMTAAISYPGATDVSAEDYLVVGLATCYIREEGEVHTVEIAEPIPSAALEAILKGIPTSYRLACGTKLGEVVMGETLQLPASFSVGETQFCDDFAERAIAATRTYKSRVEAQTHIPYGTTCNQFNYSTERKRLLNSERIVKTEDNVKQHEYTHKVL